MCFFFLFVVIFFVFVVFFQAEDGIRVRDVTGVQTCALPISGHARGGPPVRGARRGARRRRVARSEEHTSELQSHHDLVCRLLLEKKKNHTPTFSASPLRHAGPCPPHPIRQSTLSHHCLFFFNDTATTEIYTLSLHDALPISRSSADRPHDLPHAAPRRDPRRGAADRKSTRLNSSHITISYAVFCLKKKKKQKKKILTKKKKKKKINKTTKKNKN